MKAAMIKKVAAVGSRSAEKVRITRTRPSDLERPQAAADQQVAEIERTFSVRWEW